jgi:MFS family permease
VYSIVGIFGAFFQVGSLAVVGIMMGFTHWESNWSWRVAFLIQAIFPLFVCATIYSLCPESPRYMVMKGQREKARRTISQYFTSSEDVNHPFVDVMMSQIDESIENSAVGFRATWDFRVFFTKAVWFRTFILLLYSIFQQWNGNSLILLPASGTLTNSFQVAVSLVSTWIRHFKPSVLLRSSMFWVSTWD